MAQNILEELSLDLIVRDNFGRPSRVDLDKLALRISLNGIYQKHCLSVPIRLVYIRHNEMVAVSGYYGDVARPDARASRLLLDIRSSNLPRHQIPPKRIQSHIDCYGTSENTTPVFYLAANVTPGAQSLEALLSFVL